jgi:hypothetical protein
MKRIVIGFIIVLALTSTTVQASPSQARPIASSCLIPDTQYEWVLSITNSPTGDDIAGHFGYASSQTGDNLRDLGIFQPHETKYYHWTSADNHGSYVLYLFSEVADVWHYRWYHTMRISDPVCDPEALAHLATAVPLEAVATTNTPDTGCTHRLPIDASAQLVRAREDVALHWAPMAGAATPYHVLAGQTAVQIGEADGFARVVWGCDILWLPLGKVETGQ